MTVANSEVLFKNPFGGGNNMRIGPFFDMGAVYSDLGTFGVDDLRVSIGGTVKWFTVVGPVSFNLAWPIRTKNADALQRFQFTLGVDL